MSWTYQQATGRMFDSEGDLVGTGYSGGGTDPEDTEAAKGKNNPAMQDVHNVGPLPEGVYTMQAPVNSHVHGKYAIPLTPAPTNQMYGRDAFMCHGDSIVNPGWASDGCIIQAHDVRVKMWESQDHQIAVVSGI